VPITYILKRITGAALLSTGIAVAGEGMAAGSAQARPNPACNDMYPCETWCPGDRLPNSGEPIRWNMNVCHDWYYADGPGMRVIEGIPPARPIPPLWVP
jgi:hypothetical protein